MAEPGLQAQGVSAPLPIPSQVQAGQQVQRQQEHHAPPAKQRQQIIH